MEDNWCMHEALSSRPLGHDLGSSRYAEGVSQSYWVSVRILSARLACLRKARIDFHRCFALRIEASNCSALVVKSWPCVELDLRDRCLAVWAICFKHGESIDAVGCLAV